MAHDAIPTTSIVVFALASLRVWPGNPRKTLGDITDLTASIRASGIDQPLIVRAIEPPLGDVTHEVIDGQRRYHAATEAGSLGVPCLVRTLTDAEALEIALRATNQREPVNALEEAEAIHLRLSDEKEPCTVEQLADRMGHEKRYILRRLSLLGLSETARGWFRDGTLPLRHAETLASLDAATQAEACGRYKNREIPPYKAFARDVSLALTVLHLAPFDVTNAKLVPDAGACGPCPKNSATQPDLFGGVSEDAHCCNRPCWDAKVEANWQHEVRVAKRKRLAVLEDVIQYATVTRNDVPYVSAEMLPKGHEQPQTALTRSESGHVIALYDRPAKVKRPATDETTYAGGDEMDGGAFTGPPDADPDADPDDDTDERATHAAVTTKSERQRQKILRILALASREAEVGLAARVALHAIVVEFGDDELVTCLRALDVAVPAAQGQRARDARAATLVASVPGAHLLSVLMTCIMGPYLIDEPDPADVPPYERELRERLEAPEDNDPPAEVPAEAPVVATEPLHRVLLLPDDADWSKYSRGLAGWSAEKTPGAGGLSGGANRPLLMEHTPTGHGDIEKLLARLDKAGVPYLDLGDRPKSQLYDCAPSYRATRELWNLAHPTHQVTRGAAEPGWAPVVASEPAAGTFTPVRVWIAEKVWNKLPPGVCEQLEQPDVGLDEIPWEGAVGYVHALIKDAKTLDALEHLLSVHKVKHEVLFDGEKVSEKKTSKKGGARA